MANRKVKKKSENNIFYGELVSIGFIILGIISLISLFSNKMGLVGSLLYKLFSFLGGTGNFLFPLIFIFLGFIYNINKLKKNFKKYIISSIIILLCILVFLDGTKSSDLTLIDRINLSIEFLDIATSGGVIGSILGFFLYKLFGSIGTYAFLISIIIINIYLLVKYNLISIGKNKSLFTMITKLFSKKSNLNKNKKTINKNLKKLIENVSEEKDINEFDSENIIADNDVNKNILEENYLNDEKNILEKKTAGKNINLNRNESDEIELNKFEKNIRKDQKEDNYIFPPIELLKKSSEKSSISNQEIIKNGRIIEQTMENFGIDSKIVAINRGPVITCYELEPAPGVKLSKIVALNDNLSMSLASPDIRIEAPIPGKSAVGIEVPNKTKESVTVREIIQSSEFKRLNSNLPLALGKDVSGSIVMSSIDKMPHLLIAGATGSGKSVCINTIITNILYKSSPKDVRLLLIDPKVVELSVYNGIPHLLIPVVTDPKKAAFALNWAVGEMEKRYKLFAENSVRDLTSYNKKIEKIGNEDERLPKIVVIVDELADLMMVAQGEVEDYIARLAQMARAAGIYLIIATQRPSVDVITGTIKANIPSRIAFSVSSAIDSRTILDMAGAEKLLGKGDMLFYPGFYSKPVRIQGSFISDEEVESVVDFIIANSTIKNDFEEKINKEIEEKREKLSNDRDPLFNDALKFIVADEQASISFLQRKLKIGYSRAARIVDQMEESGILGPHEGSRPRKLLLSEEEISNLLGENNE
uniref:FtsK/SpoIIIE family DNA translocase n=1 Tax=Peptoniphilus mikwangii TaxID=1354300 RepID=UPI0003FBE63D|nr:DNA translocase FtsK [Peptoniphilus mikwangii]